MTAQPIFYKPKVTGFAPYHPYKAAQVILDDVGEVLDAYSVAMTLRQIYYRLVATRGYPKTDAFYQKLSSILARARRAGLIDWDAIRDDGVTEEYCGGGYTGLDQFKRTILRDAEWYERSKYTGQSKQIIVLCEAAGMVPQIVDACGDYPVIIRSCGGMDSVTAKRGLAKLCTKKDTVILHCGDHDPSGLSIFHAIYFDVRQMAMDMRSFSRPTFDCKRVLILEEHLTEYGLLTGTIKSGDACKEWYPGLLGDPTATCEAESLPPDELQRLVREAVEAEVDMDAYFLAIDQGETERQQAMDAVADLDFDSFGGGS